MKNKFTNRDFYFSAFLIANGQKLLSHTRESGITTFMFEDNKEIAELSSRYYSLNALVEPMSYGNALKTLKSIIHSTNTNTRIYNNEPSKR